MILAGTKVTCPECGAAIAELLSDVHQGEVVIAESFRSLGARIENGLTTKCHMCSANWFDLGQGRIHTESGWAC